ncbi:MAG: DUF3748 domain-containing protein, partial [Gemmataceae bacterium]|nr:DUF3748 domain-containing protein [Gemmataceae bacterium]
PRPGCDRRPPRHPNRSEGRPSVQTGAGSETRAQRRPANLDARDLVPPFTPGALRGGTHLHSFNPDGSLVAFTYDDHVLGESNQRNVGVCVPGPVSVPKTHPRNHDGTHFSVLLTRTVAQPRAGTDEIGRASEEAWLGQRSLAFQGETAGGIRELYAVDVPSVFLPGDGPLEGTATERPFPPKGAEQRRLTRTADRRYPGLAGPRHWPRSEGGRIACLMRDDAGIVQLWIVDGEPRQLTHGEGIASAFTWERGRLAFVTDGSVCVADADTGAIRRLTPRTDPAPRPEACVLSPDGRRVAFVRPVDGFNQVFVAEA